MTEPLKWKAEIKFAGSPEEFNKMLARLDQLPVEIAIPEWERRPNHLAGCMPFPLDLILGDRLLKLVEDQPHVNIKYIRDIRGGMRMAHVHIGDEVVFLDRARFKTLVSSVAQELGGMRAEKIDDYIEVMDAVGRLDPAFKAA